MKQIIMYYGLAIWMFLLTFVNLNMGMDYITFDKGMHPAIAFPLGVLALLCGIACYNKADRLTLERKNKK